MKKVTKILMVVALAAFSFQSFAQTEKGRIAVSGESTFGFSSMTEKYKDDNGDTDGDKTLSIEFAPQVGYFVIDNLAVGVALPISFSSTKDTDDDKSKMTSMAIAPFARYYFGASNIKPYLQGAVGFGSAKYTDEPAQGDATDVKMGLFLWDITGGVGIFLNDNVSLDLGASYSSSSMKPKENNDVNAKFITSGFGLNIGFTILF